MQDIAYHFSASPSKGDADAWTPLSPLLGTDDCLPNRSLGSFLWISWPQKLTTERTPTQVFGVPLHLIAMNAHIFTHKFGPHHHEECVEDIQRTLTLDGNQTTIKSSTKFHHLRRLPRRIELLGSASKLFTCLHGIGGTTLLQYLIPFLTKRFFELIRGDGNFIRSQNSGLARNGIVVLINQLLLINGLAINV
ncbi:hypothetical protein ACHAWU_004343 [Discostella pseudostelligera]|uniref:Uncharacterized protein n=1 Tax=Discostella pseudostelligera TaxID=259834 RepID=A0ABD3N3C8_9STRA